TVTTAACVAPIPSSEHRDGQIAEELASLETARVLLARTLRNLILAAMSAYAAGVPLAACQDPLEDVIAALDRALDEIPWVPA
ncbi:MAG: hypothetical protein M0Z33_02105, partial [Actinomycetota bacterium]|nr:hypothetical protein [Actinomycetota bacterium]